MTGGSKIRSGGGLTAPVAFSREMNTSGTGVVGIGVTFGVTPLVLLKRQESGGNRSCRHAGDIRYRAGRGLCARCCLIHGFCEGDARKYQRMMMHTVAMSRRIRKVCLRTVHMEEPFVCSINIVIIALKYECFPIHAGEREMAKSRMITHYSGGVQILGIFERKRFVFRTKTPLTDLFGW